MGRIRAQQWAQLRRIAMSEPVRAPAGDAAQKLQSEAETTKDPWAAMDNMFSQAAFQQEAFRNHPHVDPETLQDAERQSVQHRPLRRDEAEQSALPSAQDPKGQAVADARRAIPKTPINGQRFGGSSHPGRPGGSVVKTTKPRKLGVQSGALPHRPAGLGAGRGYAIIC